MVGPLVDLPGSVQQQRPRDKRQLGSVRGRGMPVRATGLAYKTAASR